MREIKIADYTYELPNDRIAAYPLAQRDKSKLLVYKAGSISHESFQEIATILPPNTSLYFNDTKVIPARLVFNKDTGAKIEIFLLKPADETIPHHHSMEKTGSLRWQCTIGNLKRWSNGIRLQLSVNHITLNAELVDRNDSIVELSWQPNNLKFVEILNHFGATPLPPYIKRNESADDKERYQTVYSKFEGAVAAPTAGLHFTPNIFRQLEEKNISKNFLTLHVSAGTFQPVKTENAIDHDMHSEQLIVSLQGIENLLTDKKIIAVGTTSMRILESLYWFGTKLLNGESDQFTIGKLDGYSNSTASRQEAFEAVLDFMRERMLVELIGSTSIYIMPGYNFRVVDGLITNFHQPGSTLMLLVAAFVGEGWKKIYAEALDNDYRFLSYGDSSLLLPK